MAALNSLTDFSASIEPVVSAPLVSYPANGWVHYLVEAKVGSTRQTFVCP